MEEHPSSAGEGGPARPNWWLLWILLGIFAAAFYIYGSSRPGSVAEISYSRFLEELEAGNIERVTVKGESIRGVFKKAVEIAAGDEKSQSYSRFVTFYPSFGDEGLFGRLQAQHVEVQTRPESNGSLWNVLWLFAPILILIAFILFFSRRMQSAGRGIFSMGANKAKLYDRRREKTTFQDVAGAGGAKSELEEIIVFLRNPARVYRVGGEMPKGVLLIGPPGTGKTLLARAVAGEAEVPFYSMSGSDFMEMFVGVGASRVRELFADAKKAAPSIIFIDELDSIGRHRGAGLGGGHDEREQTLNQLLSEMDGFEPNVGVVVLAATNRPDVLDPALLRPGRFDRRITVDLPTLNDRVEILKVHIRNKPLAPDLDLVDIAQGTPGFSGADLANLLNEAALLAARQNKNVVEKSDIESARDKVVMGLKRENLALTKSECELLAYHESGHAVVAAVMPHADPVRKVTIVPRARSMGHTEQLPERDRYLYAKDYLLDRLAVMMGGRAAEEVFKGTSTSGAELDLKQATRLTRKMVLDWGMGDRLNRVAFGGEHQDVFLGREIAERREYSEETAREVDEEVQEILNAAYDRAKNALLDRREGVARLVQRLLEKEEVSGEEVSRLIGVDEERAVAAKA